MTVLNALSATLILLILATGLTLFLGLRSAEAGVFQTPAGGWGIDRPTPPQGPRGDGFQIDGASGAEN